ncbi:hypothetical protein CNEONATNEC25_02190 [Clostridium neonatale]|uniref:Uncharacterized protein n=1 Tax=Clostridium neonatale TaxID=137838 RepID=A0A653ASC8_9CLOT|nr:hypothetical protein CNEONATNEC25_02190 [Clostridium neonatale]
MILIIVNAIPAEAAENKPINAGRNSKENLGFIINTAPINVINKNNICLLFILSLLINTPNIVAKIGPSLDNIAESDNIKCSIE